MFRKPRLRRKAVCRQIKLRRLRYPRKHARMAHRHDDTDATRHSHTLSCDRKNQHRRKTARQTHATIHAYKQRHITQGAMHYSKSIPSKSVLGLLRPFFHADHTYLRTQNAIYPIPQTSMLCSGDGLNCKRARKQNLKTCSMRVPSYKKGKGELQGTEYHVMQSTTRRTYLCKALASNNQQNENGQHFPLSMCYTR